MSDPTMEWVEEGGGQSRRLICHRSSGYEADIVVEGNKLSARLFKPHEVRDSFSMGPESYPEAEIENRVERVKAEIEDRLEELECGHS
jgi:hypothetical protein